MHAVGEVYCAKCNTMIVRLSAVEAEEVRTRQAHAQSLQRATGYFHKLRRLFLPNNAGYAHRGELFQQLEIYSSRR